MPDHLEFIIVFGVWAAYSVVHSLTASLSSKNFVASRVPAFMPWYRVSFNVLALLLLALPVWITWAYAGEPLWRWGGLLRYVAWGLTGATVIAFVISMRYYDGMEFLGIRQLSEGIRAVEDQERLCISPFHHYVRHPWYSMALVLIWCRDMDAATLSASLAITLYFILGSRLEERKLLVYHGERYRRYLQRVPGLIPLPWRYLDSESARELERSG